MSVSTGFFEKNGDSEIGEYLPDLPPSAKRGLLRMWQRFLDSEEGMGLGLSDTPSGANGSNIGRNREREFEWGRQQRMPQAFLKAP